LTELSLLPQQSDHCQFQTCFEENQKKRQPKQLRGIVPKKNEGMDKPLGKNSTKRKIKWHTKTKQTKKMERCTNRVRVQQNLIWCCRFQSEIYAKNV
jgi:hypothetical protein